MMTPQETMIFMLVISGVLFLLFLVLMMRNCIICRIRVRAVCVDHRHSSSRKHNHLYTPIWEFSYAGNNCRTEDPVTATARRYKAEKTYTLYINPENPETIRHPIPSFMAPTLVFGGMFGFALWMMFIL